MWKRPSVQRSAPQAAASTPKRSPWHAVSVVSSTACCGASLQLLDTRFLSKDAPRLPLSECTLGVDCRCLYQHHDDRRGRPRRAAEAGNFNDARFAGHERRHARGRRASDTASFNDWKG